MRAVWGRAAVVLALGVPAPVLGQEMAPLAPGQLEGRPGAGQASPLQARVDAAASGTTIEVGPGSYEGDLLIDKPLRLDIYSYKLVGGNNNQDVKEINVLNHYIGMKDLVTEDFTEFKWLPFAIGIFGLLFLRAAVLGKTSHLVDVAVLFVYFGLFALWSFGYKMYQYGHNLDPKAAVRVDPFMPPMFGFKKLANFEVYSYPQLGSYALGAAAIVLLAAFFLAWRQWRREPA